MNASTLTNRFSTTETHKIAQHTTDEIVRRFGFKPGWETTPHTVASALISAGWLPRGTQVVEGKLGWGLAPQLLVRLGPRGSSRRDERHRRHRR